jgi:hypothetical protein
METVSHMQAKHVKDITNKFDIPGSEFEVPRTISHDLAEIALEPDCEAKFEPNSCGFRPGLQI